MKPFLTTKDQFNLLKSRVMNFHNSDYAKDFLLRKNYFNTSNVYGKYFLEKPGSNIFKEGTYFEDISFMYHFEKNIRDLTFALIMNMEANIRSTISYYFSKKFPSQNSYKDIKNFDSVCLTTNKGEWDRLQNTITRIFNNLYDPYNPHAKKNAISHYTNRYGSVPLWVLINEFALGNTIAFFRLIDINLKDEITRCFSRSLTISYAQKVNFSPSEMMSYLNIISDFRNKVAHDSYLSIYRTPMGTHPVINNLNKPEYPTSNQDRDKFYDVPLLCRFFVSKTSYYNVINEIIDEISMLEINLIDKSVMSKFMDDLGFNFYTF